jgi:hypothetical protein
MAQPGLQLLAFRHVAVVDDDAVYRLVVQQVADGHLHVPPRAVGVPQAAFDRRCGVGVGRDVGEHLTHVVRVGGAVRVDPCEQRERALHGATPNGAGGGARRGFLQL